MGEHDDLIAQAEAYGAEPHSLVVVRNYSTAALVADLHAALREAGAENERLSRLTQGIDSVRSHWYAAENPRWTSNVIEALRHSGLMDDPLNLCPLCGYEVIDNVCGCPSGHPPAAAPSTEEPNE